MGLREEQKAAGQAGYASGKERGAAKASATGQIAGTAAGAAIGTAIMPGVGTAIGAMVGGAAGGLLGSLFGGGEAARKAKRKARRDAAIAFNRRHTGMKKEAAAFEAKGRSNQAKADSQRERIAARVGGVAPLNEVIGEISAPAVTIGSSQFDRWENTIV